MILKYNDAKLLGQNVEVSWFKDIRKARKRVIENEEKYHDLLVTFDNRRRPFGRFPARRPSMCPRRFVNPPPHRIYRPPFVRQRVSSNNSSDSDSHSSSNSDGNRRSRRLQRRGRSPSSHGRKRRFHREHQLSKPGIRRTQSSSSSSSYSSSSSSSSAPSRRSTTKKPTFQYNTAEAEKEVLQATRE
ncbi:hypothetical protein FGIG_01950 [Fasciola gigantica]|uniref:Uncharacterized protein n=1 Tax=Fasciola gigantica TaxID=46835 RepID=A0A504Z2C1_FASGI|nr:hypothetical protein FGIG_01950 [Fasciola gigantica]